MLKRIEYCSRLILCCGRVASQSSESPEVGGKSGGLTHIVLLGRRDGVNELLVAQKQLAALGVGDSMLGEASLGLGGQLLGLGLGLLVADERLLDRLLDGGNLGRHGAEGLDWLAGAVASQDGGSRTGRAMGPGGRKEERRRHDAMAGAPEIDKVPAMTVERD